MLDGLAHLLESLGMTDGFTHLLEPPLHLFGPVFHLLGSAHGDQARCRRRQPPKTEHFSTGVLL